MIESLFTVAKQVAILFALMSVGFFCNKKKYVDEKGVKGMVNVLILIVTPCLIVHSFQAQSFRGDLLVQLSWAFAFAVLSHLFGIVVGTMLMRGKDISQRSVLRCATTFSNAGFMGIPLEYALLGPDGVFYGVAYVVVFNIMYWSWGLVTYTGSMKDVRIRTLFVNPGTIGIALGLPFFLFSIRLPEVIDTPVKMMADLNTPLAMIVIGYSLADAKFGAFVRNFMAYVTSVLRLVVLPCMVLAFMYALFVCGLNINPKMAVTMTIAASAPSAAMTTMFAVRFGRDVSLSVGLVSFTTLASIITMPPIVALAMWLFGV